MENGDRVEGEALPEDASNEVVWRGGVDSAILFNGGGSNDMEKGEMKIEVSMSGRGSETATLSAIEGCAE